MATEPKPISDRVPNYMAGNAIAFPIEFDVPDLATAKAEYDAHMRRRVPHQAPDAPAAAHRLRREWLEQKEHFENRLQLAIARDSNRWEITRTSDVPSQASDAPKHHRFGHSHPCPWRKTSLDREEEYRLAVSKLGELAEGTPEWSKARNRISWMKKAMMRARREEMRRGLVA